MGTGRRKGLTLVTALGIAGMLATGLTGCAGDKDTTPTPPSSASPSPSKDSSSQSTRVVPKSCSSLDLDLGAEFAGEPLSQCVAEALRSFGSGKEQVIGSNLDGTSGDLFGEIEFSYDPDFAMKGTLNPDTEAVSLTYIDGVMWIDSGQGLVKGDVGSSDPMEMITGQTAELYRLFSDPSMTRDLIAANPSWVVDDAMALKDLPDGTQVEAYRIENAAPFTWQGIQVKEYILWYAADWIPVGNLGGLEFEGLYSGTTTQTYYDLGQPVTIEPPVK
ncbi:hypothetical protein G7067_05815 [Leucobacter insecticola]|uniref:LppX_LprAFG lipoprotein n=1 Tax=Leucobacter insecticola TaxID=2714934 RepID=A0A6G8FI53_9MICO|nr:hypothetical protein [Leucobacter insecticola]QIM16044.1 hypothetical protein G7067_05815 [Leucobacter insecticola]